MALTYTPRGNLGSALPHFHLKSVEGKSYSHQDFLHHQPLLVMFICNHCPYVKAVEERLLDLARRLEPQGAQFLAICSNDSNEYPEDSPQALYERWREKKYPFVYLLDEQQTVAKDFGAVCTPDFFLYDQKRHLVYRGRLDDSWKDASKVTRRELEEALVATLQNKPVAAEQLPAMGCSIKWL